MPRQYGTVPEESFRRILSLERKRTERSQKPFLLMLLDAEKIFQLDKREVVLQKILSSLACSTRETDITGWCKDNSIIGVIFTEIALPKDDITPNAILARVNTALRTKLGSEEFDRIDISLHVFPDDWGTDEPGPPARLDLYPDLSDEKGSRRAALFLKRAMDILGSATALVVLSPLLLVISAVIRCTSEGPILFRQRRVGRYGKKFTLLKFRTMYISNDPNMHKEYVRQFISGTPEPLEAKEASECVYKIKEDPRVTRVGKFLRRISLDELPQFFNVLQGEMSLVGPRPPIPYECDLYDLWHRRRVLEAKPGITGLWQVKGRSKTRFDDMVRLDLKYARTWSLWLDIKILLQTPRALFSGEGAY